MQRHAAGPGARGPRAAVRAVVALVVGVVVGSLLAPAAAAAPAPRDSGTTTTTSDAGCRPRLALGVFTPGQPNTVEGLLAFEAAIGRTADVAGTFTSFRYPFNVPALRTVAGQGRLLLITLEPWDPTVPTENRYSLRDIAAGAHDTYLRAQAGRLRELGQPVALRFAHEMNGTWYPWGAGVHGNTPADYVAAYRHVHDLVEAEGVTDVRWVWSPATVDSPAIQDVAAYYPGDDYVDWAGLSVYYDQTTDTWARSVAPTVRRLQAVAPHLPLFLAETGVLPGPGRPAMIRDLIANLAATPGALGFTWFDVASRHDWRIVADPAALTAVREGLAAADLTSCPTIAVECMVPSATQAAWRPATAAASVLPPADAADPATTPPTTSPAPAAEPEVAPAAGGPASAAPAVTTAGATPEPSGRPARATAATPVASLLPDVDASARRR